MKLMNSKIYDKNYTTKFTSAPKSMAVLETKHFQFRRLLSPRNCYYGSVFGSRNCNNKEFLHPETDIKYKFLGKKPLDPKAGPRN